MADNHYADGLKLFTRVGRQTSLPRRLIGEPVGVIINININIILMYLSLSPTNLVEGLTMDGKYCGQPAHLQLLHLCTECEWPIGGMGLPSYHLQLVNGFHHIIWTANQRGWLKRSGAA